MRYPIFTILLLLAIAGNYCKSPSNKIVDEFKKVNDSLDSGNTQLLTRNTLELNTIQIQLHGEKNPALAQKADSLYQVAGSAFDYMQALKQQLQYHDSTGERTDITDSVFFQTDAGNELISKLVALNDYCYYALADAGKKSKLDSAMHDLQEFKTGEDPLGRYFKNLPVVGAVTVLNKFQNDCLNTSCIVLRSIKEQLK